jgi:hypothetical protein
VKFANGEFCDPEIFILIYSILRMGHRVKLPAATGFGLLERVWA